MPDPITSTSAQARRSPSTNRSDFAACRDQPVRLRHATGSRRRRRSSRRSSRTRAARRIRAGRRRAGRARSGRSNAGSPSTSQSRSSGVIDGGSGVAVHGDDGTGDRQRRRRSAGRRSPRRCPPGATACSSASAESDSRLAGVSITEGMIAFTRTWRCCELRGEHLGEPVDAGLGDGIRRRPGPAGDARARADVHDRAARPAGAAPPSGTTTRPCRGSGLPRTARHRAPTPRRVPPRKPPTALTTHRGRPRPPPAATRALRPHRPR